MAAAQLLVVDDDNSMRRTLESLFREEGYAVSEAASAADALELVRAREYDVVLTDVASHNGAGVELVGELRRFHPKTSVVLIADHHAAAAAQSAGATALKPFEPAEVLHAVERALARRSGAPGPDALSAALADAAARGLTLQQLSDFYIEAALEQTGGRKGAAARLLGIDRKTLYRRHPSRH